MNKEKRLVARFIAAFALARLVHMLVLHGPTAGVLPSGIEWMVADVAMFGILGLLQGLSLMAYGFQRTAVLGLCSAVAGLIPFGHLPVELPELLGTLPALAAYGLATGALLGVFQLIVLSPHLMRRALWPLLLALAWAMGYVVEYSLLSLVIESISPEQHGAIVRAADVLASMIIGGITGVVFILLHGDTDERARRTDETGQEHRG